MLKTLCLSAIFCLVSYPTLYAQSIAELCNIKVDTNKMTAWTKRNVKNYLCKTKTKFPALDLSQEMSEILTALSEDSDKDTIDAFDLTYDDVKEPMRKLRNKINMIHNQETKTQRQSYKVKFIGLFKSMEILINAKK